MSGEAGAIALAERILAILDQGSFSATYKYALFTALLDLAIEKTTAGGPPTSLTTRELAERVLALYWCIRCTDPGWRPEGRRRRLVG